MNKLPDDMITEISKYIEDCTIVAFSLSCKRNKKIMKEKLSNIENINYIKDAAYNNNNNYNELFKWLCYMNFPYDMEACNFFC